MVRIAPVEVAATDLVLDGKPFEADGLRLALAPSMARYSLRARSAGALSALLGRDVPERIGAIADGIACLGPDEWYALLPGGTVLPQGGGQPLAVVDVSSRAVGLAVTGPRAVEVIGAGCPRDIARIPVGTATRTIFETVEIQLWRTGEDAFHIEVWRSFAPWLWHALVAAARD